MEEAILQTVRYFSVFAYAPSFEEIDTFLPLKTTKKVLRLELERLVAKGYLVKAQQTLPQILDFRFEMVNCFIYTLPSHRIFLAKRAFRARITQKKVDKVRSCIEGLTRWPEIKLIGLSGASAMGNARQKDDVDLFIITGKNRLFSGRFLALATTAIFGRRRRRGDKNSADRICLNLFFDEDHLAVPKFKQNLYVAHEILQLKPLVNKDQTYERFLAANRWVSGFFPNKKIYLKPSKSLTNYTNYIGDLSEFLLKKIQLYLINQHRTKELITDCQLWFFPDDFEQKLKRKGII